MLLFLHPMVEVRQVEVCQVLAQVVPIRPGALSMISSRNPQRVGVFELPSKEFFITW